MRRDIKFRGKDKETGKWVYGSLVKINNKYYLVDFTKHAVIEDFIMECLSEVDPETVGQYIGIEDKNYLTDIYEGDILGGNGLVIGNKYENTDLLKDKTNLLIKGFGAKAWFTTYQKAMEQGCHDSE